MCAVDERNGWAFKTIDYIVFPTGVVDMGESLLLTVGRNDNSGWAVVINTAKLVDSLVPVLSDVKENRFARHASFAIHEDGPERRRKRRRRM